MRITDSTRTATLQAQIARQRERVSLTQEQVSSGKRINRPSDDPAGTEVVLTLRSSLTELTQFGRNADAVSEHLQAGDDAIGQYQELLDQARAKLAQGASNTTTPEARKNIADALDSLRAQALRLANTNDNSSYVFGGTRQTAPPFDPVTAAPALPAAVASYVQVEPNALPIATGVTAENIFSDTNGTVFAALSDAAAALRGTGDAAADAATLSSVQDRVAGFLRQSFTAQGVIGANQNYVEAVRDRLASVQFTLTERTQKVEDVDLAEAAVAFTEAQRDLEATLQTGAQFGRRSLLDFLG